MKRKYTFQKMGLKCITFCIAIVVILNTGCNKDDSNSPAPPTLATVSTYAVSSITALSANCGGDVSSEGGASVTAKGVCWSTSPDPTISNSHTTDGGGSGMFFSSLTGLSLGTQYYVRAYATNSVGTAYGSQQSFTTSSTLSVGLEYEGGTIFYVDFTGVHGLVSSPDLSTSIQWGCSGTNVPGASGSAIGTGAQNTAQIIAAGCATGSNAAAFCNNLTLNGYTDWFLPSIDELTEMFNTIGLSGQYWSSTEDSFNPSTQAKVSDFGSVYSDLKTSTHKICAVRAF